ncbi:hypothetical protein LEMA_P004440.1 [Plenodomus lingam JN3]|uniref:Stress response RCI peptide n=1 Tax=Leptosphaeria maculans (strain JN3 / isolate v23.1.3 / race Av1-4-5-6-7-8) TaxID=985895 RepID=E5AEL8_LEPMJ|nr:hypothetical protein LEMA_P004440.1 [Plenodomus lingam JN3]CBY01657.1 hypothetical protein LEMA_P004440.1 [Plenodomus lingam JN3]
MIKTIFLIILTVLTVLLISGCSVDLVLNVLLTFLGYLPGHLHAFYLEYVYIKRRDERRAGVLDAGPVPGVFSGRVLRGGGKRGAVGRVGGVPAGGMQGPVGQGPAVQVPVGQGPVAQVPVGQRGYGTVR